MLLLGILCGPPGRAAGLEREGVKSKDIGPRRAYALTQIGAWRHAPFGGNRSSIGCPSRQATRNWTSFDSFLRRHTALTIWRPTPQSRPTSARLNPRFDSCSRMLFGFAVIMTSENLVESNGAAYVRRPHTSLCADGRAAVGSFNKRVDLVNGRMSHNRSPFMWWCDVSESFVWAILPWALSPCCRPRSMASHDVALEVNNKMHMPCGFF